MGVAYTKRMARGLCGFCGHEVTIARSGIPMRSHKERRVQRGPGGVPEIYKADKECQGSYEPAERLPEKAALRPVFQSPGGTQT